MVYRVVYIFIYIVESVDNNKSRWQRGIEVLRIYTESSWGSTPWSTGSSTYSSTKSRV